MKLAFIIYILTFFEGRALELVQYDNFKIDISLDKIYINKVRKLSLDDFRSVLEIRNFTFGCESSINNCFSLKKEGKEEKDVLHVKNFLENFLINENDSLLKKQRSDPTRIYIFCSKFYLKKIFINMFIFSFV